MKIFILTIITFLLSSAAFGQVLEPNSERETSVKRALSDAILVTEYDCKGESFPSAFDETRLSLYLSSLSTWVLDPAVGIEIRNESTEIIVARESSYRSARQIDFIVDPSGVRIDEIHEVTERTVEEERNVGTISAPDYQTVLELIKTGKITCLAK